VTISFNLRFSFPQFFALKGEFISFAGKRNEPKKSRPTVLACGCSARFGLGRRCGTRYAQTVLALSAPALPCSTTLKRGLERKESKEERLTTKDERIKIKD